MNYSDQATFLIVIFTIYKILIDFAVYQELSLDDQFHFEDFILVLSLNPYFFEF
jgi:hypothetical protein